MTTTRPTFDDLLGWLEAGRQQGQVHFDEHQQCWHVLGHPEASAVLSDPVVFSSDLTALQPHQDDLEPRIAELTTGLLDGVGERFDLVDALAHPLPVIVIADLVGVPTADRPLFRRWADVLLGQDVDPDATLRAAGERAVSAVAPVVREMTEYLL